VDKHRLAVLRGKLKSAEVGLEVRMFTVLHVRLMVEDLLEEYPDMPEEELERVENLKLAVSEPRGLIL
jgi:hypothetical protein